MLTWSAAEFCDLSHSHSTAQHLIHVMAKRNNVPLPRLRLHDAHDTKHKQ